MRPALSLLLCLTVGTAVLSKATAVPRSGDASRLPPLDDVSRLPADTLQSHSDDAVQPRSDDPHADDPAAAVQWLPPADRKRHIQARLFGFDSARRTSGLQALSRVLIDLRDSLETRLDLSIELMQYLIENQESQAEDLSYISENLPLELPSGDGE